MTIWDDLAAPFPEAAISWRAQSLTKDGTKAMALAYIDARDVMRRLDEVIGPENWKDSYVETAKGRVLATIEIWTNDRWVSKSDGAGDTDVEGDKGGISDAFKRAAVKWGIGRYLYDMPAPWVPCDSYEQEWQDKKKWVWKSWKESPWNYVRKPSSAPSRPSKPVEAPKTFVYYLSSITSATNEAELKDAFAIIWKADIPPAEKKTLQEAYNAKKADLIAPGNNFDQIASGAVT